jgi:Fe-S oxidoreductase
MFLSWPERSLFLALSVLSAFLFWRRIGAVLELVRRSRPDPDFHLRPLARRLRRFLLEVLLQAKVIRQRPLPGLAHALVFWGFCAFALVTLNHLALALGVPFLSPTGSFGGFYFRFAAVFALVVAVSIAGLAIRRFQVRPKWLGPLSPGSGLIAFLIFLLMATYLARFWLPEETTAGRLNWWAHTLALLVFLPVIPHTKHLHLIFSPAAVFLDRGGFSKIPPLVGDEDFGLDTGRDLTRLAAFQAFTCVECGRCTEHCPASHTGKILDPKQIVLGTRAYLNEHGAGSAEPLLGKHLSIEAAFQCTSCGACEYQCPVGIQHLPLIIGLRRGAVNTGKWEDPHGTELFLNLERHGNSLGFSPLEREKFIHKNGLPIYEGTQQYCLWLGCMGSYDPQGREIVLALVQVLRALGISFGVLRKEQCTGDPVRRLGNDLLFQQLAQANLEHFRASGVTRLLSICPHCVRTISEDWSEFGAAPPTEHHSELLARFSAELPRGGEPSQQVVYHDACYLGRYRGVYDQPRRVIERWGRLTEPPRAKDRGFCCGAGGGQMFLGEEKGRRVNLARAEELIATGTPVVASACPFCYSTLRDGLAASSSTPPNLLDIAQIAAASLAAGRSADDSRHGPV